MDLVSLKIAMRGRLTGAFTLLPERKRIVVETPRVYERYVLTHPNGAAVIMASEETFGTNLKSGPLAKQLRDSQIIIYTMVRASAESEPEEYNEFIINQLTGMETDGDRDDRYVYCTAAKFIEETDANVVIWALVFRAPQTFRKG